MRTTIWRVCQHICRLFFCLVIVKPEFIPAQSLLMKTNGFSDPFPSLITDVYSASASLLASEAAQPLCLYSNQTHQRNPKQTKSYILYKDLHAADNKSIKCETYHSSSLIAGKLFQRLQYLSLR